MIVLEKDGGRLKIYIGCGTGMVLGVRSRMTVYDRTSRNGESISDIPRYVELSLQDGWKITHKFLLAWTP